MGGAHGLIVKSSILHAHSGIVSVLHSSVVVLRV